MSLTKVSESMSMRQAREGLTNLLYLSTDGSYRDLYRSGWLPSGFNQQWGGSQWGTEMQDAATGQTYKFTVATGNVQDDAQTAIGYNASYYNISQGFKVSESMALSSFWVKLSKVQGAVSLNPTAYFSIYSDNGSGGISSILTSQVAVGRLSTNTNGDWYRINLPTPLALTAGVQYHIAGNIGGTDAANYVAWKGSTNRKYPNGYMNSSTSGFVNTAGTGSCMCFLIEAPSTSSVIQPSGKFDSKLSFAEGSPVNQSRSLTQPLKNFFDGTSFTYLLRGDSFAKGKPICDFLYGLDHDRIVLTTSATTGFGILTLYTAAGTVYTVSGTSDLSTAAFKDVAIVARTKGDTGDYLQLWVNGVLQGQVTGSAFVMDPLMRELGTAWVGGGFPVAPGWTAGSLNSFASLPSAQGWTWTGTATEANAMSVSGGKLFQNKSGCASTDGGYYAKQNAGFNNTNGWVVEWKGRVASNTNTIVNFATNTGQTVNVFVFDGSKMIGLCIQEYFIQVGSTSVNDFTIQGDFKTQEHVFTLSGKGSDYYLWIDGKLAIDGTGKLVTLSATNCIYLGDVSAAAGENADAIYSYLKYSTSGAILPQASTGSSISEAVFWSGDKSKALPDLYNAGNAVSAKTYCGLSRGYVGEGVVQKESRSGTGALTTTSSSYTLIPDLDIYSIGGSVLHNYYSIASNSTVNYTNFYSTTDGVINYGSNESFLSPTVGGIGFVSSFSSVLKSIGLHKNVILFCVNGGTGTSSQRSFIVETKS